MGGAGKARVFQHFKMFDRRRSPSPPYPFLLCASMLSFVEIEETYAIETRVLEPQSPTNRPSRPSPTFDFKLALHGPKSLMVFELLRPHADSLERQMYRAVRPWRGMCFFVAVLPFCGIHLIVSLPARMLPRGSMHPHQTYLVNGQSRKHSYVLADVDRQQQTFFARPMNAQFVSLADAVVGRLQCLPNVYIPSPLLFPPVSKFYRDAC